MSDWVYQLRRGDSGVWSLRNPVLREGEPGVEVDTHNLKIGDGVTPWNNLPYVGADSMDPDALEEFIREIVGEATVLMGQITDAIADPNSSAHGAVVTIVHDETEPLIPLDLLFDNAKV